VGRLPDPGPPVRARLPTTGLTSSNHSVQEVSGLLGQAGPAHHQLPALLHHPRHRRLRPGDPGRRGGRGGPPVDPRRADRAFRVGHRPIRQSIGWQGK
jgi:hypothetical protein